MFYSIIIRITYLNHIQERTESSHVQERLGHPSYVKYVENKGQEKTGLAPLKYNGRYLTSDTQSKTEILNDQFHIVFTKEDMDDFLYMVKSTYQAMDRILISRRPQTSFRSQNPQSDRSR